MLLGPEGTSPARVSGFCCLWVAGHWPRTHTGPSRGFHGSGVLVGFFGVLVGWWVFVNWIVDASIL